MRSVIGAKAVASIEEIFFDIKDIFDRIFYKVGTIFEKKARKEAVSPEQLFNLPNIEPIIKTDKLEGEGVWTLKGMPKAKSGNPNLNSNSLWSLPQGYLV